MSARVQTAPPICGRRSARRTELRLSTPAPRVRVSFWLLVVVTSFDLWAQTASTGALSGTVTDPSSAVVADAKITLHNYGTDARQSATSGQNGSYRFSLLPAGEYELTVEAPGFEPAI